MCHTYRRGLCDNPFPGDAEVSHTWDSVCPKITTEKHCGGYLDWRTGPNGIETDDPDNDSKAWQAGKGSYGHCMWDVTAGVNKGEGKCQSKAPKRFDPYTIAGANQNNCGGVGT